MAYKMWKFRISIADIAPSAVKIDKLLHRMEEGEIKVRAFQRGFVWRQAQVVDLLDSIYNDFPIGSIKVLPALRRFPVRVLMRLTNKSATMLKRTLAGKSRPRPRNRVLLQSALRKIGAL